VPNTDNALARYLVTMKWRLRLSSWIEGTAVLALCSLVLTLVLSLILNLTPHSPARLSSFRIALFLSLGIVAGWVLASPLLRLRPRDVARELEHRFPEFDQRLLTWIERRHDTDAQPFLALLAENAMEIAKDAAPNKVFPRRRLLLLSGTTVSTALALTALIARGHGAIASGAQQLWTSKSGFSVELQSARQTVCRGCSLPLLARLDGFASAHVNLWDRSSGSANWTSTPMIPAPGTDGFGFVFAHLAANTDVYAESEGVRSQVVKLTAVDLPRVSNIRVSYAYPPEAQLSPEMHSEDAGDGDVIAPAGTVATIEIETDRPWYPATLGSEPWAGGQLTLDNGDAIPLQTTRDNKASASLRVMRDDSYRVSVMYDGKPVPVSEPYAIEVLMRDSAPMRGLSLLEGVRAGIVPAGYEGAVARYYKRLGELQTQSTADARLVK